MVVLESLFSFITTVVFTTIGWILAMSRILQSISLDIDLSQLYTVILAMSTSLGINTYLIPEPMGTCVEMLWFWSQNPWEINSFLAFALSRVVGKG